MVTTVKEPRTTVDEELKRINEAQLARSVNTSGSVLLAAGIIEMLFGLLAIGASTLTGAVFTMLLGAAVVVSGVLELVSSIARNNLGRFALGIIGIVAGALVLAHPIYGLAFLATLVALYLVAAGIARLFGTGNRAWSRAGGAIGIILGIIVFAQLGTIAAPLIGVLVGISILIDGIITTRAGSELRRVAR